MILKFMLYVTCKSPDTYSLAMENREESQRIKAGKKVVLWNDFLSCVLVSTFILHFGVYFHFASGFSFSSQNVWRLLGA